MKSICSSRWLAFLVAIVTLTLVRASSAHAQAQAATLTGRIASESGQPLENANAFITELNISVPTNPAGRYNIVIPAERVRGQTVVLRIRAIGHLAQTKEIVLRGGTQTNDFELKRDINRLQEVVVTGMTGATEQKKTTFAITSLNADQDLQVKPASALASIAGKVPGATVVGANGRPGTAPAIMLRGAHSINTSGRSLSPLIIVDGVILNGESTDINPDDIESIEIVKGAAGASLYGSAAGNGVISIRTKRAADMSQGMRIEARQETGADDIQGTYPFPTRHFMLMNEDGTRYCIDKDKLPSCSRTVSWEAEVNRINDVPTPSTLVPYQIGRDYGIGAAASKQELKGLFMVNQFDKWYNPVDQIKTNQPHLKSTITLSGKMGATGYYTSFDNFVQEGPVKNLHGYTRQSARANIDQQIGSDITMSMQTMFTRGTQYPNNFAWFGLTRSHAPADFTHVDAFGRLVYRADITAETSQDGNNNPLYFASYPYGRSDASRVLSSLTTHWNALSWLSFESTTSLDERKETGVSMTDKGYRRTAAGPGTDGSMNASSSNDLAYNLLFSGTATHNFGNDLTSRLDARYTFEHKQGNGVGGSGSSLTLQGLRDLDNATTSLDGSYSESMQRTLAGSLGLNLGYKDRYFFDGSARRDGSSLFGEEQRYHNYYRGSLAWLMSDEPWFARFSDKLDQFKLRAAVGTAGGRPSYAAQYEVLTVGTGGSITANSLGNKNLRPETTLETEYGVDMELFHKYGVQATYARDITTDQILQVPPSVSSGFVNKWLNAGTVDSRTWELSFNAPIITRRALVWTSRLNWDQTRSVITSLDRPEYTDGNRRVRVGERFGTVYGKKFVRDCNELPADFAARCGSGKEWQANDEGYIVWVGQGNTYKDGITKNLWQSQLGGCLLNGVARTDIVGATNCIAKGGTPNTPWGQPIVHWGMLTTIRDSSGVAQPVALGNSQPAWKIGWSHNLQYKRMNVYALIDRTFGNRVYNEDRHWSWGDFMTKDEQQDGKSVETAKPIGYYWRATSPENAAGVGGMYEVLGANSISFEDGSYTKLREVSVSYNIGPIRRVPGNWSITAIGRNLYTWTKYTGWDPDVGSAVYSEQSSSYPQIRNFTLTLGSKF
jgi:TonB-linked SusC/RagA family outer membrane protein